jgi:hypothetical protein
MGAICGRIVHNEQFIVSEILLKHTHQRPVQQTSAIMCGNYDR